MLAASLGALLTFAAFVAVAMSMNEGVFEYPLDDVYIHLAMSEQIARGGYGVNAGEFASAASSPVYPLLLLPFAGEEAQRWWPLMWNVVALILAAAMVGWALARADLGRFGLGLAFVSAFALNTYIVAYSGMENMAHGAASLAIVIGLWRFAETGQVGWLLILGVCFAPMLRPEGLALALAAAGVVTLHARLLPGLALGILAALPLLLFAWFLTTLGLDPLPNSVSAKLPVDTSGTDGFLAGVGLNIRSSAAEYGGRYLIGLTVLVWTVAIIALLRKRRAEGLVGLAVSAASIAHLSVAEVGWLDRYENYLLVSLFAVLALMLAAFARRMRALVLGLALLGGVLTYGAKVDDRLANMRAIHDQHGEMSRFAKDFAQAPVAVNDLGYVAWRNPNYVLDLYGLASREALELRAGGATEGWADPLADRYDVAVAMIYDRVLKDALGPEWVWIGDLILAEHGGAFLGGDTVAFYARDARVAESIQPALRDWAQGLPEGSGFSNRKRGVE